MKPNENKSRGRLTWEAFRSLFWRRRAPIEEVDLENVLDELSPSLINTPERIRKHLDSHGLEQVQVRCETVGKGLCWRTATVSSTPRITRQRSP